jgi:predicted nucleotidyltransferase
MTEKQYENIGLHIIDGYICRSDGVHLYVPPEIVTELNNLSEENEQLKSILFDTVERLKVKINPNEDILYAVTLVVDGAMYFKIKEIIQ